MSVGSKRQTVGSSLFTQQVPSTKSLRVESREEAKDLIYKAEARVSGEAKLSTIIQVRVENRRAD